MVEAAKLIQRVWRGGVGHLFAVLRAVARLRHHEEIYALRIQGWWRRGWFRPLQSTGISSRQKRSVCLRLGSFFRVFRGHKVASKLR